MEGLVAEALDEGAVDKHVNQFEQGALAGVVQQLLEGEAGVAPDGLLRALADGTSQLGKSLGLVHGVAAAKGNVSVRVGLDDAHNLVGGHGLAAAEVPGLRVMAALTMVTAARAVDRRAEPRAVDHRVLDNGENRNQGILLFDDLLFDDFTGQTQESAPII